MDDLETRLLGTDDWEVWRQLRLSALADAPDAFGATLAEERGFDEARWRRWLGDDDPQVLVLDGGRPVAIGAGYREETDGAAPRLHVIAMWTDPAYRGRRLAAQVLTALVEWAAPRDLDLALDVAIGNTAARRSYEAFGFVRTGAARPLRDGSPVLVEEMVLRRG
ncbi:MAG: GNAT family N-acetyltransferase [Marmoricola sp.]